MKTERVQIGLVPSVLYGFLMASWGINMACRQAAEYEAQPTAPEGGAHWLCTRAQLAVLRDWEERSVEVWTNV